MNVGVVPHSPFKVLVCRLRRIWLVRVALMPEGPVVEVVCVVRHRPLARVVDYSDDVLVLSMGRKACSRSSRWPTTWA